MGDAGRKVEGARGDLRHYYTPTWMHSQLFKPPSKDIALFCDTIVFNRVYFVCEVLMHVSMYTYMYIHIYVCM